MSDSFPRPEARKRAGGADDDLTDIFGDLFSRTPDRVEPLAGAAPADAFDRLFDAASATPVPEALPRAPLMPAAASRPFHPSRPTPAVGRDARVQELGALVSAAEQQIADIRAQMALMRQPRATGIWRPALVLAAGVAVVGLGYWALASRHAPSPTPGAQPEQTAAARVSPTPAGGALPASRPDPVSAPAPQSPKGIPPRAANAVPTVARRVPAPIGTTYAPTTATPVPAPRAPAPAATAPPAAASALSPATPTAAPLPPPASPAAENAASRAPASVAGPTAADGPPVPVSVPAAAPPPVAPASATVAAPASTAAAASAAPGNTPNAPNPQYGGEPLSESERRAIDDFLARRKASGQAVTRPAVAVSQAKPVYPDAARQRGERGSVDVVVAIDDRGRVTRADAVSGPESLRRAAEAAVRQWRYDPALAEGVPVASERRVRITFQ